MLDLVYRNFTSKKAYPKSFFGRVLGRAARMAGLKGRLEVSVTLAGPSRMRSLNRKYRRVDKSTDVLSFPLYEILPKRYTEISLGDIFICPQVVSDKAREQNMSEKAYVAWAAVHGFLHLAGYDHARGAGEEKKMSALERRILTGLT